MSIPGGITRDELEIGLRKWGWIYGERPALELSDQDKAPATHPIARAMEFAQRGVERQVGAAWARAIRTGERAWSRDPIKCTETRSVRGSAPAARPEHQVSTAIQQAWLELKRVDALLAEVLRLEYQVREQQGDKATAMGVGRGKYRELLAEAKGWVFAKLSMRGREIA